MLYIETNLYASFFFLLRLFSYKNLAEFNVLGVARKYGKTKTAFRKKNIYDSILSKFYIFCASCQLRSVQTPVLIKLRYPLEPCPKKFKFHDYLGSFFKRRYSN